MAVPVGPKLQVPQLERIRAQDTHVADALEKIVGYVNQNTTPIAGNAIIPANTQTAKKGTKVTPLNALK